MNVPRLLDGGSAIAVEIDGATHRFHAIWLRDSAQDCGTRDPDNGQRRITVLDIPADIRVAAAEWIDDALSIRFDAPGPAIPFARDWLIAHSYDRHVPKDMGWIGDDILRWSAAAPPPVLIATYPAIRDDAATRLQWLQGLRRFGFARVTGIGMDHDAPLHIAALLGHVRETNYGRVFDVRAAARPANLADTALGLQAHTDNPYRDPVPGLQILCCLVNQVSGGETALIDGFEVARRLRVEAPEAFALLSAYEARFAYAATGVRLHAKRPLIELGVDGELRAIRFNNRSAAPFVDIPYDEMAGYYRAYRHMAGLIEDPALAIRFRLRPGEAFVVDNLRVLHARTAFASDGERHLRGCYVDRDGLLSAITLLEEQCDGRT